MQAEPLFWCSRCGDSKLREAMSKQASRPNGLHGWCKACMNSRRRDRRATDEQRIRWNLRTRYDITPERVAAMRAQQGGVCAICAEPMRRECVDHDHTTGNVRGLLCHPCNIKLHALDSWPHRAAAEAYLASRAAPCAS